MLHLFFKKGGKIPKKKTPREISPSADGDKGYAPLTAPPLKSRAKLSQEKAIDFSVKFFGSTFFSKKVENLLDVLYLLSDLFDLRLNRDNEGGDIGV